jgi:hypothetical protein
VESGPSRSGEPGSNDTPWTAQRQESSSIQIRLISGLVPLRSKPTSEESEVCKTGLPRRASPHPKGLAGRLCLAAPQCAPVIQGFLTVGGFPGTRCARRKLPGECGSVWLRYAVPFCLSPKAIATPRIGASVAGSLPAKRRRVRHRSYYTLRTVVTMGAGCYTIPCRRGTGSDGAGMGRHPRRRATPPTR